METKKVFAEMNKAEEIGAISINMNGHLRFEITERDDQIAKLQAEVERLRAALEEIVEKDAELLWDAGSLAGLARRALAGG